MVPALLHHTQASSGVRVAQLAAITLTAVVAAVLVLGPKSGERVVPALSLADPGAKPVTPAAPEKPQHHADVRSIAVAFGQLGNSPKPPPKPDTPATPDAAPTPVVSEESVRFLGSLAEPGRRLALLKVNDRQRLLAPGEKVESMTVVEVGTDFVVVEDSHGQRRLSKGERQGPAVTYTTGNLGAAPNQFNPGAANAIIDAAAAARNRNAVQLGRQTQPPNGAPVNIDMSVNTVARERAGGEQ